MLKLFSKDKAQTTNQKENLKRLSSAELRMQKDLAELSLPNTIKMEFDNVNDLLNFRIILSPDEGFYKGGKYAFTFLIKPSYPHDPPKVSCIPTIYHPNIDLQGNVCLNILREDWKPVLSLNSVIYGLQFLFLEPNPDDPLNKEAAAMLKSDRNRFVKIVCDTMRGYSYDGTSFTKVI